MDTDLAEIPLAPEKYRRPENYTPVLYPRDLHQIAKEESAKMMRRAAKHVKKVQKVNAEGKYPANGYGIDQHKCPEWFIDAKLGMFIDWGIYSVASYYPYIKGERLYPDWYENRAYINYRKGHSLYGFHEYHVKNWGEDFKRDHFIDLFRGTDFDAPKLAQLFKECGAKYVIPYAKHHSGFCTWNSSYTFRDSWDQGAHRDFMREMADACKAEDLKFGVYNSQADEWEYPVLVNNELKIKMWGGRVVDYTPDMEWKASGKVAVNDFVYDYIVPQMTEFIDKYDPDILWYDADWSTYASENGSYDITAYLYNTAEGRKEVCTNDRLGRLDPSEEAILRRLGVNLIGSRTIRGDFYTDEWGDTAENIDPAKWHPWESCSGISMSYGNHWMEEFNPSMVMTDKEFIVHFMDIVSRGGNLLLLVNLDGQGALPKIQEERIHSIGKWLERWGEGIYASRILAPFSTPDVDYTKAKDDSAFYATVKNPSATVTLECKVPEGATVTILGENTPLTYTRSGDNTLVKVPSEYAVAALPYILKIVP
ncbi:MAG: alpha-L-fucosidase [Bacteroidales bacterium]|nr:alpha-L-fucosidase [Bacteroidales bacterium]